jgi:hypothetical protein
MKHETLFGGVARSDLNPDLPTIEMNSHDVRNPAPRARIDSTLVQRAKPSVRQILWIPLFIVRRPRKSHCLSSRD